MLRLAILSYWHVHARDYERDARNNPETEVVAVWDDDAARGRAAADSIGARFVPNLDDVLADPGIDGVVVTTATSDHLAVITAAAKAGKPIITEKVIAPTLREAKEIVAAVDAAGVPFMVVLFRLSSGATHAVKAAIDSGQLGEVTHLRIRVSHNGALRTPENPDGWLPQRFYDPVAAAGGALIDLGAHPLYLSRYFLGLPDSVSASYAYHTGRAVEDNAIVTLRYPNGALATAEVSFTDSPGSFLIEAHGTAGSLSLGIPDTQLRLRKPSAERQPEWTVASLPPDLPSPFDRWVAHVQAGTTDPENIAIATDLSALAEAANRSAAESRPIRLSELATN